MKLYEIAKDFKAWEQLVDEVYNKCNEENRKPTDEEMESLLSFKDENESNLDKKLENIVKYYKNLESDGEELDREIKRLQAKKKAKENIAESLKNYLDFTLKSLKIQKRDVGIFTLSIQKNRAALKYNTEDVPDEYLIPQPSKVDVTKIMADIKGGKEFDWCELVQSESIRIR